MKHFISKVSIITMAGIMMATAMTGCGNNKDNENNSSVSETTTSSTTATTIGTSETSETETTTVAETTEEVTETTIVTEDEWLAEWKNSDSYITGISDLRENMDSLYAVHILVGGDAIKAYELGFDNVTSGYDLVWKFDDEEKYYVKDFNKDKCYTIDPAYDCSLKAEFEEIGQEVFDDLFYNKTTNRLFLDATKNDKYNPFENSEAEYQDNTVCIIWQKSEGTLDGATAFYYSVNADNYSYITDEAFINFDERNNAYYQHNDIAVIEDTNVFDITGTGSLNDEETEKTSEETSETETAENVEETTSEE